MSAVFVTAEKKAKDTYGSGWKHMSATQQRNAIAFEIMALSVQQDASVSADRMRQVNDEAYAAMVDTMNGMRRGWPGWPVRHWPMNWVPGRVLAPPR